MFYPIIYLFNNRKGKSFNYFHIFLENPKYQSIIKHPIISYLSIMKILIALASITLLFTACSKPSDNKITKATETYLFLVGTYTDGPKQGLNILRFSPEEGTISAKVLSPDIQNPSFVIATGNGERVFTLEETAGEGGGDIVSFSFDKNTMNLHLLSKASSGGNHPCYIGISPNEKYIAAANYTGGSLSILSNEPDGSLNLLQTIQHEGSSINEARQNSPHVHSTVFNPAGDRLLVADLGTDKIYNYQVSPESDTPLSLVSEFEQSPGDGPRHLTFSKDGKTVFVVQELTATLEIYDFQDDTFSLKQRLSLLDEGFTGDVGAAEVRVTPDGQNVYASNRGDANTISVFLKNNSGVYERIQNIPSGGIMPRNFNFTKDGEYLLAAHQASNDVVVFKRNQEDGTLSKTTWKVEINKPVYLFQLPD